MEGLKERLKLLLAVFQYGMTFFLGVGVSLITYLNKRLELGGLKTIEELSIDWIIVVHAAFMILAGHAALTCIRKAIKVNRKLIKLERKMLGLKII